MASNQSAEGKSQNRRIEIVLAPEDQAPSTVVAASAKKAPASAPAVKPAAVKPAPAAKPAAKKK